MYSLTTTTTTILNFFLLFLMTNDLFCEARRAKRDPPRCPRKNEEYFSYAKAVRCQEFCGESRPDCPNRSTTKPGCVCKYGYVRKNVGGECINIHDCPYSRPECPKNMHYVENECIPTCQYPIISKDLCQDLPKTTGCSCNRGFVKLNDRCVRPQNCPARIKCGPNAVFLESTGNDQRTCDKPRGELFANAHPVEGCVCRQGYIRKSSGGQCIPYDQCPNKICPGQNEEYVLKPPCQKTCQTLNQDEICHRWPEWGCACKNGFVREKPKGKCILVRYCRN